MMNKRVKSEWLELLRSDRYQQVRRTMKSPVGFCPLGLLCEVHRRYKRRANYGWDSDDKATVFEYLGKQDNLPEKVVEWAGLTDEDPLFVIRIDEIVTEVTMSQLNDVYNWDFKKIANLVEAEL